MKENKEGIASGLVIQSVGLSISTYGPVLGS